MNHIGIFFWFFVVRMMMVRLSSRLLLFFVILFHVSLTCYECLLWETSLVSGSTTKCTEVFLSNLKDFLCRYLWLALTMVKTEINDG